MDPRWSGEAKYQTLLAVAQAANSRREVSSVLDAVAAALEELVPIDLLVVVTHQPDRPRLLAAHYGSTPRRAGEGQGAYLQRLVEVLSAGAEAGEHAMM